MDEYVKTQEIKELDRVLDLFIGMVNVLDNCISVGKISVNYEVSVPIEEKK